jgi:hypothetical protein
MERKKQVVKTATPLAPAASPQYFEAGITSALNNECTQAKQSPTTHIRCLQEHKNDIYEEGFQKAQDDYLGLLERTQQMMYDVGKQEGRKAGYEEELEEGEERGRTAE